jgi:hypothetical protein
VQLGHTPEERRWVREDLEGAINEALKHDLIAGDAQMIMAVEMTEEEYLEAVETENERE